jgi:hypothetical protein
MDLISVLALKKLRYLRYSFKMQKYTNFTFLRLFSVIARTYQAELRHDDFHRWPWAQIPA